MRDDVWDKFSAATKIIHDKRHDHFRSMKSQFGKKGDKIDVVVFAAPQLSIIEMHKVATLCDNKTFKVAYNIQTQDKKYKELTKKYHTMDSVKIWENKKLNDLNIEDFLVRLNNSESTKLNGIKDAYTLLNYEQDKEKSFWEKLFNFNKKEDNKKIVSLSSSTSYETKDERFDSVVVVKTGSGMGSGFFISEDVIEGAMTISIINKNKKKSSAVVIKTDLKRDLALLKTNMKGKPVSFFSGQ